MAKSFLRKRQFGRVNLDRILGASLMPQGKQRLHRLRNRLGAGAATINRLPPASGPVDHPVAALGAIKFCVGVEGAPVTSFF